MVQEAFEALLLLREWHTPSSTQTAMGISLLTSLLSNIARISGRASEPQTYEVCSRKTAASEQVSGSG
ncbi:MAG: hypothetical protein ACMZI0_12250 [Symbiopectobacterium sp.]|uniref:hypothetical protein n=1 Tax=Symbiopectobacterium sp. TaxID=2952789 RepID=UPI0039E89172